MRKKKVKWTKWFLWLAPIMAIAIFLGWKWYSSEPANLQSEKAELAIDATLLIDEFVEDEDKAAGLYGGKVIDVYGTISEIIRTDDQSTSIVFISADMVMPAINCLVDQRFMKFLNEYKAGDSILLRGFCTGKLFDVELNRATIIKKF